MRTRNRLPAFKAATAAVSGFALLLTSSVQMMAQDLPPPQPLPPIPGQAPPPPPDAPDGQDAPVQVYNRQELQQLAAPIALYPDQLLTQVLMASTYPLDVVQAARWRRTNARLKGPALEQALERQPWDESVKAMTAFPDVLRMMDEQLEWTEKLGEAFLAQE